MLGEPVPVGRVDLVAVAVPLRNFHCLVNRGDAAAALKQCRIGAKPHGAAEIAIDATAPLAQTIEPSVDTK